MYITVKVKFGLGFLFLYSKLLKVQLMVLRVYMLMV